MKKSLSSSLNGPASLLKGGSKNKKRVVVAMSGGVDSSAAAALLKKQGYDVVGVFMRFWHETQNNANQDDAKGDANGNGFNSPQPSLKIREGENTNTCCSQGAEQAARDVATKLGIPFYVLSAQKEFKKAVVDYFLSEEKRGRTPNPCVVCNKKIKFGLLFDKAMGMRAELVATGHYARLKQEISNPKSQIPNKSQISNFKFQTKLFMAKDVNKDQSYFLYTLTQKKLARILFPLGDYLKSEVYALAKKWRLPYRKDESFDLCFVPEGRENFLKRHLKMKEGGVARFCHSGESRNPDSKIGSRVKPGMTKDRVLGRHQGLALYTIGQRKNIPLGQGPWWVVKKDEKKNILYVSDNEKDLYSRKLIAGGVNWLKGAAPKMPARVLAKIRYKSEAAEAQIAYGKSLMANRKPLMTVKFENPQRAITPGQSIVFYSKKGELLGGGVIKEATGN